MIIINYYFILATIIYVHILKLKINMITILTGPTQLRTILVFLHISTRDCCDPTSAEMMGVSSRLGPAKGNQQYTHKEMRQICTIFSSFLCMFNLQL